MASSYCLSSTRNTTAEALLLRNSHIHLPRFSPRREVFILKPQQSVSKPSLSVSNGCTLSSYAEAEGDHGDNITTAKDDDDDDHQDNELAGAAEAFNISSSTASAIAVCIALAALSLPMLMPSLGQGLPFKTKALSYTTLLFGFYMAWNIGANDAANAMGTSVGSGALSLRKAVLTAAVLEFSGALLMGTHVTSTMQK